MGQVGGFVLAPWQVSLSPRFSDHLGAEISNRIVTLKIATWNLQLVSPDSPRCEPIAKRLDVESPDVAVLTEVDLRAVSNWPYAFDSGIHPKIRQPHGRKVAIISGSPMKLIDPVGSPHLPPNNFVAGDVETTIGTLRVIGIVIRWNQKPEFIDALPAALENTVTDRTVLAGDFNLRFPSGGLSRRLATTLEAFGLDVVSGGHHSVLDDKRPLIDHIAVTRDLVPSHLVVWPRRDPDFADGTKQVSDHAGCAATLNVQ